MTLALNMFIGDELPMYWVLFYTILCMNSFNPYNSPLGWTLLLPSWTDEEAEAQREEMTCPESQLVGGGAEV